MIRLRVKEVAQEKGFSLGRLSRASDVAYNTVKAIYRNPYKEVTFHTINRLADTLAVPATALLEDVTTEHAQEEIEAINSKRQRENLSEER